MGKHSQFLKLEIRLQLHVPHLHWTRECWLCTVSAAADLSATSARFRGAADGAQTIALGLPLMVRATALPEIFEVFVVMATVKVVVVALVNIFEFRVRMSDGPSY
jgi:hypothetical protein